MKKEEILRPRPCKSCGRHMTREFLEQRWQERNERLSLALRASEKKGRTRATSYEAARKLRAEGLSIRTIAKRLGCSIWTVHRAIHEKVDK